MKKMFLLLSLVLASHMSFAIQEVSESPNRGFVLSERDMHLKLMREVFPLLISAVENGDVQKVNLILEFWSHVKFQEYGKTNAASVMLEIMEEKPKMTALDYALLTKNQEMINLLRSKGAKTYAELKTFHELHGY